MPAFDTPEPISVTVELGVGDLRIVASDRTDTMVEVRPSDPAKKADVTAAEQTRVEYAGGRLLIKAPKSWRQLTPRGGGESIDVQVELPAGSQLRGETGVAALRCQGRLGECRYKTGVGDIQLDQAGAVQLRTGVGDLTVERADGDAELTTGSGSVRIDRIDGAAVVKNSNGDTWIGEVTGNLRVNAANGRISVDRARETVAAKSANGDVRLGEVAHGTVLAQTAIRQGRDRDPRRGRRLAGPQHALRQRAQRPGRRRASGTGRGRGRGPRPHLLRGHHHQPLRRERHRKGRDMTSPTARSAIAVAGLRKSFGDKVVLDGIDLQVAEGTIFALLGPNGAGKTTMVQILSTLIGADAGEVAVGGHDLAQEPDAVRAVIGVTGQFSAVDQLLTGEENLLLMADLRHLDRAEGRRRAAELLDRFDLVEAARKPAGTYSGGMRRRLDLAMTLVGDPRIIFLDEPTAGLDPRSRRTMWQLIRELVAAGVTIFLTTQYLEEADELADQVAVLDHGRLIAEGAPETLKRRVPGGHVRLQFADQEGLESAARALGASARDDDALTLEVPSDGGVRSLRGLLDQLDGASVEVDSLSVHLPDLDDVFLALTGQPDKERATLP